MSWLTKSNAHAQATEAAKVYTVDERYREAFMKGAEWAVDRFRRQLEYDHYEDMKGYPHEYMLKLTLKDLRKTFHEWCEVAPKETPA